MVCHRDYCVPNMLFQDGRVSGYVDLGGLGVADRFQLSLRTLQEWEQQRRVPEGPAQVLLRVIERDPQAVERALAGSSA